MSRYTAEQIAFALRQTEGGSPVADAYRQMGVSEARSGAAMPKRAPRCRHSSGGR
jgi:hypothetical protein